MSPAARSWLRRAAQALVLVAVGWYVARELGGQWTEFRQVARTLDPSWSLLGASGLVVLGTYALLIEVWRRLVATGGVRVPFARAARIWCISNLGKFLPGRVWSIGAMGALAQREGVAPGVAAGAAIFSALVNVAAGFAVIALCGARVLPVVFPGAGDVALGLAVLAGIGLLTLPTVAPRVAALVARRTGRQLPVQVAPELLWFAAVSNLAAWAFYGLAFHVLAGAVLGRFPGSWSGSVTAFTASYLAGYLAVIVPGGLGVREVTLAASLSALGVVSPVHATVLAVTSRLWLTVLEILPGVLFLARDAATRPTHSSS